MYATTPFLFTKQLIDQAYEIKSLATKEQEFIMREGKRVLNALQVYT